MSRHTKPGRNDLCDCGSGKKRKHCCQGTGKPADTWRSRLLMVLVAAAIIGGVAAGVMSYGETSASAPAPGLVWSPEHGHYH